ncbi:MAG: bifunctional phosphoribosyl-AMP cyclohydrolase/phosphoribosyl-ATP diphosphatase HisIE [Mucilaginibacter sp.]|nr:bifunctional phosphoribosyl-AMP cyclohydrolase/phosphoribosyl-ATP diphosphatase HisIE [Mucilaginibacter sp.]
MGTKQSHPDRADKRSEEIALFPAMTKKLNMNIDFNKTDGLVPVIIQDEHTLEVLMLGYMNREAYDKTVAENIVTFFSRSKNRLWTKGETSNNFLHVKSIQLDCDNDTLLIKVKADGPTCHTGSRSCFNTEYNQNFILQLEQIINDRYERPQESSYVNKLRNKGLNKIAQKVGEEAVETVIAALAQTETEMIDETSDLVFHLLVLLREKGLSLETIAKNLEERHK